ncbi:hypothetical protein [Nonomuraea typhae]|uniref:hypothetical protein n=1 Tax=Nonomuraea typhae TaxID=2603600 RepID=UPI0012FCC7ED|nr:hypothetical protein [Nonomuraea typhae]
MSTPLATRLALACGLALSVSIMTIVRLAGRPDTIDPPSVALISISLAAAGALWSAVRRIRRRGGLAYISTASGHAALYCSTCNLHLDALKEGARLDALAGKRANHTCDHS